MLNYEIKEGAVLVELNGNAGAWNNRARISRSFIARRRPLVGTSNLVVGEAIEGFTVLVVAWFAVEWAIKLNLNLEHGHPPGRCLFERRPWSGDIVVRCEKRAPVA